MRGIAGSFKGLAHLPDTNIAFAEATSLKSLEEFSEKYRQVSSACLIAIDEGDWTETINESGTLIVQGTYLFAVLKNRGTASAAEIMAAKRWAEQAAQTIARRMRLDARDGAGFVPNSLDPQMTFIKADKIGAFYAALCSFGVTETAGGCINNDDWL